MKILYMHAKTIFFAFSIILTLPNTAHCQTDADAIMIPKNYFCLGGMASYSSWSKYWEGTFKRSNANLGNVSTESAMLMANYGFTSKLNVMATVPYVKTRASAGTLASQKGLQDLSLAVKWLPLEFKKASSTFRFYTVARVSLPLSNYEPDFLPLSIGSHSKTLSLRGILDYQYKVFFLSASGAYVRQQNIKLDRSSYYTTKLIYSNEVVMPDAALYSLRFGYRSPRLIAEGVLEQMTTLGGFDIRRNDMPFPSNKMNATSAGINLKYSFKTPKGLELTAGTDYVIDGRNVGQSFVIHGGAYYLFNL